MKITTQIVLTFLLLALVTYIGIAGLNEYIDESSAEIIERVLADNTISQFNLIIKVQDLIESGDFEAASEALSH